MRGKRSKQYRKLMQQYGLSFGFREPYQVLVDADIIRDADRFKMDLVVGLERTLHGKVKPMITQCSMRHLYAAASEPGMPSLIEKAKAFERRRCDHRPEEYPEPLSSVECLSSVVDPKGSKTNKHRYVVASQQLGVRKVMREILGVPLVYINRSVMIMEPIAGATAQNREREEREKFRAGIKGGRGSGSHVMKRKREEDDETHPAVQDRNSHPEEKIAARKKTYGKKTKGPNPLSVKKSKRNVDSDGVAASLKSQSLVETQNEEPAEGTVKRKRRRKHKPAARDSVSGEADGKDVNDGE